MLKFPYGNANFYKIITDDYLYIDRTDRIPQIENYGHTLLFLRPRRFGKSLLMSVLENYYDVGKTDAFERLFGHLAIGQNPTALRNQYLILKWNFSAVNTQGDENNIREALYSHIDGAVRAFKASYQHLLDHDIVLDPNDGLHALQNVMAATIGSPYKLYLLIDEYDNFANTVLMSGKPDSQTRYEALIEGEGLLKVLFKGIKAGLEGQGLDRVFLTGVSPVVMSDVTSSFNISENISLDTDFHDLCGFREDEVAEVVARVGRERGFNAAQQQRALDVMRTFYNGYSFNYGEKPTLYNPTLTLYFLKHWYHKRAYPRRILDTNLATDRQKLVYIAELVNGKPIVSQALNEEKTLTIAEIADRFGVRDMWRKSNDSQFIVSLLYYFGVLTMDEGFTAWGGLRFKIPNLVTKQLYVEQIRESLIPIGPETDELMLVARHFYTDADMAGVCDFIEQKYFPKFDNRDYRWTNELTIKTLFMTVLANDTFYILDSETALEREYSDLTLLVRPDMRRFTLLDFVLEFKYISLNSLKLSGDQVRALDAPSLADLSLVKSHFDHAQTKLTRYRHTLETTYSDPLRLRSFSVVSVGYERLLWREV